MDRLQQRQPRRQGGAHGGRAPAKIISAPAKNNLIDHVQKLYILKISLHVITGVLRTGISLVFIHFQ